MGFFCPPKPAAPDRRSVAFAVDDGALASSWKHSASFRPIVAQKPNLYLIFTIFGRNSATVLRHTFSDEIRVGNDGKTVSRGNTVTRMTSKIRTFRVLASIMPLQQTRRFRKDEDGAVVAFTLFVLLMMLIAGGVAIDMMRHEMQRTKLQNTLDTAVLAAAGAPFDTSPKGIVEDYFAKADMASYLNESGDDDFMQTLNRSKVTASAQMTMNTHLMKLVGVNSLKAAAASSAERRIPKLEVVLVLDVSGSMKNNSKLANLKSAAKGFVTTVLGSSATGETVISIVPFSWSVTPSQATFSALAVDERHEYSTCLVFEDNDFTHATLATGESGFSSGKPVNQMVYTSVYGGFDDFSGSDSRSCYAQDYMEILPYSFDKAALHSKIDSFLASGNTSGDQGMNWGAAILDPTFRQITDDMIAAGEVDASLSAIPADYDAPETLKVIVMMGDGQNTSSYHFSEGGHWRNQNSDLYLVETQDRKFEYAYHTYKKNETSLDPGKCGKNKWECVYSNLGTIESTYYLEYANNYYNIDDGFWITNGEFAGIQNDQTFISLDRLTWEDAWGLITPEFYGMVTGDWSAFNDYLADEITGSRKNTRMLNSCSSTKNEGVIVFTIGFEISKGGTAETILQKCASSEAHYYRGEGININDAFSSIASNLVNLRLTQ
ncbi:pilus assembly protein TadG-related protein [Roseovarius sp. S1116L3]|uniref:TadE/TadG family type IV pilus assembly protein n=1 Tax=Roseovarius roseus TaxID=3342636 RepID=UPI0037281226